jgi:N-methylhydantoinase A
LAGQTTDGAYRLGIDIGGTFTDMVLIHQETQRTYIAKALTTPREPAKGVLNGLAKLIRETGIDPAGIANVIHATTLVTNAIIERKGAKTGLITTMGMRDLLEIGREQKYELYDIFLRMPEPLVPPPLRKEAVERVYTGGEVLVPLDRERLRETISELAASGVESVAVCLLHSYANPDHEFAIEEEMRRLHPEIFVSVSARVAREVREFERTSTTVANAYVQPLTQRYLEQLSSDLAERGVGGEMHIMLSSGGIASVDAAKVAPVRLIESGPAAGALIGGFFGELVGEQQILAFDMGGTTAKACLVENGQPETTYSFEVARVHRFKKGSGLPIRAPAVDLIEIGAGGGSIAHIDQLGLMKVGPESAGSEPGPACYGLGGIEPTVTDADLVLGYLNPDYFLGGEMTLDRAAAEAAIRRLAEPLGLDLTAAAWGIHNTVNENMAGAARIHIAEKGHDPRRFAMLATGGAGPVHAFRVAQKMGLRKLICPSGAGVASTFGLLVAASRMDFVHAYVTLLDQIDWSQLNEIYREMAGHAAEEMARAGVSDGEIRWTRQADMRYVNQGHEVVVPVPDRELRPGDDSVLRESFREVYMKLFSRYEEDVPVEVLNWRLTAEGPPPSADFVESSSSTPESRDSSPPPAPTGRAEELASKALKGKRQAYLPETGEYREVEVYDRYALQPGACFTGPAVVEERESTAVVGPGAVCCVDRYRNLVIEIGGGAER